ncbi:MAG: arsenate reductase ArsC [Flavobacteriaceae bacterium]
MKKLLIICTGNSCRSQIAQGFMESLGAGKLEVFSAGIETHGVNPRAIKTMKEVGIDLSKNTSNLISDYEKITFDFILTVCDHAAENCPIFPGNTAQKFHNNFVDPSKLEGTEKEIEAAFRATREEIKNYCEKFIDLYLAE